MVKGAVEAVRKWIAVSGVVLALFAVALSLGLNAQRANQIDGQVQTSANNRCKDAREGKERALGSTRILVDLDRENDGRVSPFTLKYQELVNDQYKVLRACEQLGLSSSIHPKKKETP